MAIQTKQTTFTPAQVYALFITPSNILPAPPSGYVNNILALTLYVNFVSAVYLGASTFYAYTYPAPTISPYFDTVILPSPADGEEPMLKTNPQMMPLITTSDLLLTTDATATTGDSPVTVSVTYQQVLIDN